jgi:DNA-directed RNA polymerase specialized sigma24 family protein
LESYVVVESASGSGRLGVPGVEFGRFAARVAPSLVRSGYLLTGDRGHAEDLAQVTLWGTARRWGELSGSQDVVVDRGRDGTEGLLERNAEVQAVRGLPRRQREVVVLRFLSGSFGRAGSGGGRAIGGCGC